MIVGSVAAIGFLGLVAAAVRPDWQVSYHPFTQAPQAAPTMIQPRQPLGLPSGAPRTVPTTGAGLGHWLVVIAIGVAFVLLALAVFLWWRTGRRQHRTVIDSVDTAVETEPVTPLHSLQRGVVEAERRLLGGGDPTNAIIAAWLALEEAAAGSGVRREPSQTPTEFTVAVVDGAGVEAAPVRELLRLYHRARFSVVGSPPEDLAAARRWLKELAASWHSFSFDIEPISSDQHGREHGSEAEGRL